MSSVVETTMSTTRLRSQQEFLLQGSINDNAVEDLLHRLQGLCDNADSSPETFHDHEMIYSIRSPTNQTTSLRVRRCLEPERKEMPWHLRYLGQPEIGDKNRATLVRSCVDVAVSQNITPFLLEMGFKVDFEYLCKGYMFKKGRMKVIVAKVSRMPDNVPPNSMPPEPIHISHSYLVELSVVAPSSGQEGLAEEVKAFADQLKPLVNLDKIDHRRLQMQM